MLLGLLLSPSGARGEDDDEFLAGHFAGSPAANGEMMETWGLVERTLLPEKCGICHQAQLADWSGSRHSQAMGPGVLGQLLDDPKGFDSCNNCHAPILEQRPWANGADSSETFREDLRAVGLACPSCHVRNGEVHGPLARNGPAGLGFPHGGYEENEAFQRAEFCGTCHQFKDTGRRVAGELVQNTLREWEESPWGQRGEACQTCHMPDRRHLWRGIHDPEFTEGGLDIDLVATGRFGAAYTVTSTGVGHRFPTYITPRVSLVIRALNAEGEVVAQNTTIIQRRVDLMLQKQPFDTRLHPGESAVVELEWRRRDRAVRVEAQLLVEPDEFYRRFYDVYGTPDDEVAAMIELARQETVDNTYVIGVRSLEP